MKVLVGCEFSGRVRDAFIARGHDAMSCDFLPTDSEGPHYQGNVFDIIHDGWDLAIFHPPCTYLTRAAEWAYSDVQTKKIKPNTLTGAKRRQAREEAVEFVLKLANSNIPKIAIENPVGVLSVRWRKPDQFIQPYEYGEDASKRTCLWLKNLPLLKPTSYYPPRLVETNFGGRVLRWGNQTDNGQSKNAPSANRWKDRSVTFNGWALAMAEQWG
jgi:hypothetical protein